MGHIVSSPLPSFTSLAEAIAYAMPRYEAEYPGLVFAQMAFGPVVICRDGSVREAEYVVRGDGLPWVVVA